MQRLFTHPRGLAALLVRLVAAALTLTLAGLAMADPPMRVARLGYLSGEVTFSPAGEDDWVSGTLNRPLITGDRLWSDNNGRVELQVGNAAVRLASRTMFTLTNLDDRIAQMHLEKGTLLLRVRGMDRDQVIEVDTPNLAFVINQPGEYRISVNADTDSTEVITRSGRADVYDEDVSYSVVSGRGYRFFGAGLSDYDVITNPRRDEFERWAQTRDRGYDASISARYVSREVIGYQDLDQYGRWSSVPEYGNVWTPTRVSADWAPYRDGHWSWIEPWGWTWVDDQPWGFTVSHYGRWANTQRGWAWVPGPITARPVYAPALVAFIGGSNFQISASNGRGNVGAVGWFPLGPRDVYRPAYAVSRNYFTNVNVSNTVINNTIIVNNYNNRNASVGNDAFYANRAVRGAIVTVPTSAFVQSQPVARAQLRVSEAALTRAPVNVFATVAPQRISVLGAAQERQKPPQMVERRVVAQSMPPAAVVGFAVRERALAANPGKPIEPAALQALKPVAPPLSNAVPRAPSARPGNVAQPMPGAPATRPNVEIVRPRAVGQATVAPPPPPPPPSRTPSDRRAMPGQPLLTTPTPRDPNPVVAPAQGSPAQGSPAQGSPVQGSPTVRPTAPAPQETARPGMRPPEQRGQPVIEAPTRDAPPAPRGSAAMPPQLPPGEQRTPPREQREPPTRPSAIQPAPVAPVRVAPAAVQPVRPPVVAPTERAPMERAPHEPQRVRPERPEALRQAPVTPTAPPAVRAPEPPRAATPPPKPEVSEQKPHVVVEKRDGKRVEKKDEKQDKEDEERKRK